MLGLIDMDMDLQQKRYPTYNKKQQHFPPLTSDRRYVKQQRNFHLTTYQHNVHIRYKMREILIRVLRQSKQESLFHDGLSNHLSQIVPMATSVLLVDLEDDSSRNHVVTNSDDNDDLHLLAHHRKQTANILYFSSIKCNTSNYNDL